MDLAASPSNICWIDGRAALGYDVSARSSFGVVVVEGGDEVLHHRGGVGFLLPTDDTRRERHCQNDSSYRRNDIFSTTVVLSSGPHACNSLLLSHE